MGKRKKVKAKDKPVKTQGGDGPPKDEKPPGGGKG